MTYGLIRVEICNVCICNCKPCSITSVVWEELIHLKHFCLHHLIEVSRKMLSKTFFWMFIWWVFWSGLAILNSWLYFYTSGTHLDLFTQTLVYEISHFNFSLFFFFQAMDFMDTLFIDSLGFFFLSNLNNDCFSVCGGATVREAAVATSEASLLSSFCGTHASSMSLMCFFFCFFFFCFKADILTPTLWLKSIQLWCNKGRFWSILENWSTPVVSVFFLFRFFFFEMKQSREMSIVNMKT